MRYVTISDDTAVIKVEGSYDLVNTMQVKEELDQAFQNGCTKVIVDFSQTEYFDSSVIRDLTKIRRDVGPNNFSGRNAHGKVYQMLKLSKLDSWLTDV